MPLASDYFKSNWVAAKLLELGVTYQARIVSAGPHTFEDGSTKLTIRLDWKGMGIVLNKTRNMALIEAFGVNYDTWIGREIAFWRDKTMYAGDPDTACVAIEPIVNDHIAAQPAPPALGSGAQRPTQQRQTIDERRRGRSDIRSGAHAWDPGEPPPSYPDDPGPEQRGSRHRG